MVVYLKHGKEVAIDDVRFDSKGRLVEQYNLHGLEIINIMLPWMPEGDIGDCNVRSEHCKKVGGIYPNILRVALDVINATVNYRRDPDNDWGLEPEVDDWHNRTWKGVMGSVIRGDSHMSGLAWIRNPRRSMHLDYINFLSDRLILAVTPKPPAVDIGLFIRPFRTDAWIAIIIVFALNLLCLSLPFVWNRSYHEMESFEISKFSAWFFFILINAFYGGAMTMFFASEPELPFSNIREVMREIPGRKNMPLPSSFAVLIGQSCPISF